MGSAQTASGINDAGVVVGQREITDAHRAFVWQSGTWSDLPSLGGAGAFATPWKPK